MDISPKLIQLILRWMDTATLILKKLPDISPGLKSDLLKNLEDAHKEVGDGHKIKDE